MGNLGCNANAEIAILTIAFFVSGSCSSGTLVNSVDLAPNFSGLETLFMPFKFIPG